MWKRILASALCVAALFTLAAGSARAQGGPSPDKAALIKELTEMTNSRGQARAIMDSVTAELRRERERVFEISVNGLESLSQSERDELVRKERADAARIGERVNELFMQRIDLDKIVDEVSYILYDRHFTDGELRDLIAFYKTPTGRKSITVMPQLFADSMAETGKRLTPHLEPIFKQLIDEERRRVEGLLPPPPPPKPTPKPAPKPRSAPSRRPR